MAWAPCPPRAVPPGRGASIRRALRRARSARAASLLALTLLLACASLPAPVKPATVEPTALHYSVELAPSLETLTVTLCFEGSLRGGLIPGHKQAFPRLKAATWLGAQPRALRAVEGLLEVPEELGEGCLRYVLDLHPGGSLGALGALVERVDDYLVTGVPGWLWRPRRRASSLSADLRFVLPAGMRASVAFEPLGDGYRLDPSALVYDSYAAFGAFSEWSVALDGTEARVALLGSLPNLGRAALEAWLGSQIRLAAQSDGRFPGRALQVLLLPQNLGSEPFGNVARGGGGASVLLLLPTRFDAATLARDWVLPHELSHLLLPFLVREDAWLAEGFATYYQEVLRARAGLISEAEALSNLAEALRSARQEGTGRTLCEESRSMHRTHAYRAVYWGGAGHWLNVDVALREARAGGPSLDALLSELRAEARVSPPYTAPELLAELDRRSGTRLFSALESACERAPFPDFEPSLRKLGVPSAGGAADEAAASRLRRALFAAQAPK